MIPLCIRGTGIRREIELGNRNGEKGLATRPYASGCYGKYPGNPGTPLWQWNTLTLVGSTTRSIVTSSNGTIPPPSFPGFKVMSRRPKGKSYCLHTETRQEPLQNPTSEIAFVLQLLHSMQQRPSVFEIREYWLLYCVNAPDIYKQAVCRTNTESSLVQGTTVNIQFHTIPKVLLSLILTPNRRFHPFPQVRQTTPWCLSTFPFPCPPAVELLRVFAENEKSAQLSS